MIERLDFEHKDLETDIEELQSQLSDNRSMRAAVSEELDAYRFPVSIIPDDVLSEIFGQYVCDSGINGSPLVLAAVCKSWRNAAFRTPRLWVHISLESPFAATHTAVAAFRNKLRLFSTQSRSLNLNVCLVWIPSHIDDSPLFIDLCNLAARLKRLNLDVSAAAIKLLSDTTMPALTHLTVQGNLPTPPFVKNVL